MAKVKRSAPRSEFRTIKGKESNYLVIRFKDKTNWEYHVYAEVQAKDAARDVADKLGVELTDTKPKKKNVRQFWDKIWNEKFTN